MTSQETLKKVLVEYPQFLAAVELHERAYDFEPKGKYVMVGVRHAGKSYLLYHRAKQLMADGHRIEEMCNVNFDDKQLLEMESR